MQQMHKTSESSKREESDSQAPISLLKLVARNIGSDRYTNEDLPLDSSLESILRRSHDGNVKKFIGYNQSHSVLPHSLVKR